MSGNSTNPPASSPCMANDIAAVHGFRLLKVPLDSTRLSSNIPALLVFTTDTGNSKLAPAILHDGAAVDGERLVRCLLLNDPVIEEAVLDRRCRGYRPAWDPKPFCSSGWI